MSHLPRLFASLPFSAMPKRPKEAPAVGGSVVPAVGGSDKRSQRKPPREVKADERSPPEADFGGSPSPRVFIDLIQFLCVFDDFLTFSPSL